MSGHTIDSLVYSDNEHNKLWAKLFFGAKDLFPYIKRISQITDKHVSVHPNAGLPNRFGKYDDHCNDSRLWRRIGRWWIC